MNKYQIYKALRRHTSLSKQRAVNYEANRFAQFFVLLGGAFVAGYLIFIAIGLSLVANSLNSITPAGFFASMMPFIMILDIVFRFLLQRTPAQLIKPYLLLPLRKYDCIDAFIVSSILSPLNCIWMFLTVPYVIMTTVFSVGFFPALALVIAAQLLFACNSMLFMVTHTLGHARFLWYLLPVAIYAAMFIPVFVSGFDTFFNIWAWGGEAIANGNPIVYLAIIAVMAVLFTLNRKVQYKYTREEMMKEKDLQVRTISSFSFFDRFKQTGEYLKLEMKSMLRNKNPRTSLTTSLIIITVLSLINAFTDAYTDSFSTQFWAVYPFAFVGTNLVTIMCPEGNYIECLLIHKQNIRSLLEAKYYFYTVMLLVPLLLMLPTVFTGRYPLLLLVSLCLFTAGPMFCMLMQLAVYNKTTSPLNTTLTRKGGLHANYIQLILEMVCMFLPVIIIPLLCSLMGETAAYLTMSAIGIAFIATHKKWIDNIYRRMMARKHTNLEGFLTSR